MSLNILFSADQKSSEYLLPMICKVWNDVLYASEKSFSRNINTLIKNAHNSKWYLFSYDNPPPLLEEGETVDVLLDLSVLDELIMLAGEWVALSEDEQLSLLSTIEDEICLPLLEEIKPALEIEGKDLSEIFDEEIISSLGQQIITKPDMIALPKVINDVAELFQGRDMNDYNKFLLTCCITGVCAKMPEMAEWYSVKE